MRMKNSIYKKICKSFVLYVVCLDKDEVAAAGGAGEEEKEGVAGGDRVVAVVVAVVVVTVVWVSHQQHL